ncbi:50S ribosomal protein L22 [Candidatus Falkowbacteria bacterium]|nr:50S ribosomal protein L22 [Candidatus Falkowbacteria bacterium]
MDIKASAKHIKISPKKVRLVVDAVRGMEVNKALSQLKFINKKAALPVSKLVNSAIANAVHNYELDKNNLFVKEIKVDEGLTMKRWMPRAHGRATPIRKRTSHIALTLGEIKDSGVVESKKQKVDDPVNLEDLAKQAEKKGKGNKKELKKEEDNKKKPDAPSQEKAKSGAKKGFAGKFFQRKSG